MIKIENDGPAIVRTDYWGSVHAARCLFFLSWNASTARLLVPDSQLPLVDEMRTGRIVIISRGPLQGIDSLELMFDDDSDSPFALHIDMRQTDRAIADDGKRFNVVAWGRAGLLDQWPSRYRVVDALPCLRP